MVMKWMNQVARVWQEERIFLQMVIIVFFSLPIAYFAYITMSASMLQSDIMTLLTQSVVEGVNLIVNISMFYGAYAIRLYLRQRNTRFAYLSLALLVMAQICFLNPFTFFLLIFYVNRFLGFRQWIHLIKDTKDKGDWKTLLPSLLVLVLSIMTLFLKIKLQMIF